jgi:hypothetical protein
MIAGLEFVIAGLTFDEVGRYQEDFVIPGI